MASVRKDIHVPTGAEAVWDAIRDIGALHTRLVPGFVLDTRLEDDARVVTFQDGTVVREPIITIDEQGQRLVWSVEGLMSTHYNASVQVESEGSGSHIVWIADFLPDTITPQIEEAMEAGSQAMRAALGG
ncbi:MAG: SRPBCC family protein [Pseudomonadales bacterium]